MKRITVVAASMVFALANHHGRPDTYERYFFGTPRLPGALPAQITDPKIKVTAIYEPAGFSTSCL